LIALFYLFACQDGAPEPSTGGLYSSPLTTTYPSPTGNTDDSGDTGQTSGLKTADTATPQTLAPTITWSTSFWLDHPYYGKEVYRAPNGLTVEADGTLLVTGEYWIFGRPTEPVARRIFPDGTEAEVDLSGSTAHALLGASPLLGGGALLLGSDGTMLVAEAMASDGTVNAADPYGALPDFPLDFIGWHTVTHTVDLDDGVLAYSNDRLGRVSHTGTVEWSIPWEEPLPRDLLPGEDTAVMMGHLPLIDDRYTPQWQAVDPVTGTLGPLVTLEADSLQRGVVAGRVKPDGSVILWVTEFEEVADRRSTRWVTWTDPGAAPSLGAPVMAPLSMVKGPSDGLYVGDGLWVGAGYTEAGPALWWVDEHGAEEGVLQPLDHLSFPGRSFSVTHVDQLFAGPDGEVYAVGTSGSIGGWGTAKDNEFYTWVARIDPRP